MDFLLHGHEFNLKGANRGFFSTRLRANLETLLGGLGCKVGVRGLGMLVSAPDECAAEVRERLRYALGVHVIVAGHRAAPDPDAIAPLALAVIAAQTGESFALKVRRPDKALALSSHEVAVRVGRYIEERLQLPVDLHHAARRCTIVLARAGAIVSRAPEPGPGGMPASTAGRLLALLSSGFDSPVAAYRMIRRGAALVLLHFTAPAAAGAGASLPVVEALARRLTRYQLHTRLYLCPFAPVQQVIVARAPSAYRVLLYRRMMLRIAAALAERAHAHGLVTGDSLAQVASQTIRNLEAVNAAVRVPVYRPLIGDDKVAIESEARAIGTHELSAELSADCCAAFLPPAPALSASVAELDAAEAGLDIPALVAEAIASLQQMRFRLENGDVVAV